MSKFIIIFANVKKSENCCNAMFKQDYKLYTVVVEIASFVGNPVNKTCVRYGT